MKSKNRKLRTSDCHFMRREYASGGVAEPLCGSSGQWRWGFAGEWIGVDDKATAIQCARSIMAADHQTTIPQSPAPSCQDYEYTPRDVKCLRSEWPCGAIAEPIAGTPNSWRWGIKDRWKIKWVEMGSLKHCVDACENHYRNSASFNDRSSSNDPTPYRVKSNIEPVDPCEVSEHVLRQRELEKEEPADDAYRVFFEQFGKPLKT